MRILLILTISILTSAICKANINTSPLNHKEGVFYKDNIYVLAGLHNKSVEGFAIIYGKDLINLDTIHYEIDNISSIAEITVDDNGIVVTGNHFTSTDDGYIYFGSISFIDLDMKYQNTYYITSTKPIEFIDHTVDSEGVVYGAGRTSDNLNKNGIWYVRYDINDGSILDTVLGRDTHNDYAQAVDFDDGNLVFMCDGDNPFDNGFDPFILKTDKDANIIWEHWYGDPESVDGCQDFVIDSNGDYVVVGESPQKPSGLFNTLAAKISPEGFTKELRFEGYDANHEAGFSVIETPTGYLSAGYSDKFDLFTGSQTKKGILNIYNKDLEWQEEIELFANNIYPTDLFYAGDKIYVTGKYLMTSEGGFLYEVSQFFTSVEENRNVQTGGSYVIESIDWQSFISINSLENTEIYNSNGAKINTIELASYMPRSGLYFLIDNENSKIYKVLVN